MANFFKVQSNVSKATIGLSTISAPLMFIVLYTILIYQRGETVSDYLGYYILLVASAVVSLSLLIVYLIKIKDREYDKVKDTFMMLLFDVPSIIALFVAVRYMALLNQTV
ncbi:MAG: hypothetical protein AB7E61_06805 [Acholeplasmataceae bacterium]